jgi:hypothetical protein
MMTARFDFDTLTNYLRVLMTYILPLIITAGVILCGLWIVPDILYGMYANVDGKWMSWNHRSIREWSSFLDFGPYSPFAGTGSLFLPNLPWLNPGALALGIPAPIEYKHLFSYFVYLAELTLSMYLLFLELELGIHLPLPYCTFHFFHTFQFGDRSAELVQFGSIFLPSSRGHELGHSGAAALRTIDVSGQFTLGLGVYCLSIQRLCVRSHVQSGLCSGLCRALDSIGIFDAS